MQLQKGSVVKTLLVGVFIFLHYRVACQKHCTLNPSDTMNVCEFYSISNCGCSEELETDA